MKSITVKTKEEIKKAKDENYEEIVIIGALAQKVKRAKKLIFLTPAALTGLIAIFGVAVATAPATGGVSFLAAATAGAALTGAEIATIIAAAAVGITLIVGVFKGYEEISYEIGKLVLRKNK